MVVLILSLISEDITHRDPLKNIFYQQFYNDHLISEFNALSAFFPILRLISENITHRDFSKVMITIKNSI